MMRSDFFTIETRRHRDGKRGMKMNSQSRIIILAIAMAVGLHASHAVCADDTLLEREAKQAAAEDLAEKQLPEGQQFGKAYSGTFTLTNDDLKKSAVVGRYDVDNGASFLVKVTDSALLKRLALYDNKKCVVNGKVRNEGKYLIVTTLVEIGGAPPVRRKRGGM